MLVVLELGLVVVARVYVGGTGAGRDRDVAIAVNLFSIVVLLLLVVALLVCVLVVVIVLLLVVVLLLLLLVVSPDKSPTVPEQSRLYTSMTASYKMAR